MHLRDWAAPNVVVENKFIDVKDAELRRQGVELLEFKAKNPGVYSEVLQALCGTKLAEQRMQEARTKLTASVPPGTAGDLLDAIERDAADLLKNPPRPAAMQSSEIVTAPTGVDASAPMVPRQVSTLAEGSSEPTVSEDPNDRVPAQGKRNKKN